MLNITPDKTIVEGPFGQFHLRMNRPISTAIRNLFSWHGYPVKTTSHLDQILSRAESLGDRAEDVQLGVSQAELIDSYCFARLANSVLWLDFRPSHRKFFRELQSGDLNFWNSVRTRAKDTEWELYVHASLSRSMPGAVALIEPDIQLRLPHRCIGIACKKAYSAESVFRQIEEGARQIRRSGIPGMVAVSLDFLLGNDPQTVAWINDPDLDKVRKGIQHVMNETWARIQRKAVMKFLLSGRIHGFIFALQSYCALPKSQMRFAEIALIRFQDHVRAPQLTRELVDYMHKIGGFKGAAGDAAITARLNWLESVRPTE